MTTSNSESIGKSKEGHSETKQEQEEAAKHDDDDDDGKFALLCYGLYSCCNKRFS